MKNSNFLKFLKFQHKSGQFELLRSILDPVVQKLVTYSSVPNKRPGRLSLMRIFFPLKVSYRRFQGLDFYLKIFFPKWNFYQVYFIKQKSYPFINNFLNVRTQTIIQPQTIKFLLIYLCKDSYCVLPVYLAHQSNYLKKKNYNTIY